MSKFKKYDEFLNESLVILDLKGTMTNEFMNNIELKKDYENARRLFYENTTSLFDHKGDNVFTLRTYQKLDNDKMDSVIKDINEVMTRMKFARTGSSKITNIKEHMWKLSCKLS